MNFGQCSLYLCTYKHTLDPSEFDHLALLLGGLAIGLAGHLVLKEEGNADDNRHVSFQRRLYCTVVVNGVVYNSIIINYGKFSLHL